MNRSPGPRARPGHRGRRERLARPSQRNRGEWAEACPLARCPARPVSGKERDARASPASRPLWLPGRGPWQGLARCDPPALHVGGGSFCRSFSSCDRTRGGARVRQGRAGAATGSPRTVLQQGAPVANGGGPGTSDHSNLGRGSPAREQNVAPRAGAARAGPLGCTEKRDPGGGPPPPQSQRQRPHISSWRAPDGLRAGASRDCLGPG